MAISSEFPAASRTSGQSEYEKYIVNLLDEILMHRQQVEHRRGSPEHHQAVGESNGIRIAMRVIQGTRIPFCRDCQTDMIFDHDNPDLTIYHCNESHHCTAVDAYCNASFNVKDHGSKCCCCGATLAGIKKRDQLSDGSY